ncbi:hypothetical protein B2A_10376, partial [mine drainage metagenome]
GSNTYSDFATVTISPDNNITQNLVVKMDTVYASAFSGNYSLSNAEFIAKSNNFTAASYSNSTGIALLQVVPGNYSVYVTGKGYTSLAQHVDFGAWGLNKTELFAPVLSASVTGAVTSKVVKQVSFFANGNLSNAYNAKVSNGRFSITLPVGYYTA